MKTNGLYHVIPTPEEPAPPRRLRSFLLVLIVLLFVTATGFTAVAFGSAVRSLLWKIGLYGMLGSFTAAFLLLLIAQVLTVAPESFNEETK